jgi:hypothetical protein
MGRRHRRDEGVSIVEAAFALPILLTFIFGLVDLGMWTFNANQATNAARDGARHAILDFAGADVAGSPAHGALVDAVHSRLEDDKVESVTVSCVRPNGTTVACSSALVDIDSVKVDVRWAWDLVTPVAAILGYDRGDAVGSATMRLVGRPLPPSGTPSDPDPTTTTTTTIAPVTPCAVTHLKLEEPSGGVKRKKIKGDHTGQLQDPIPVIFTTNGADGCNDLRVQLLSTDAKTVEIGCGCDLDPPNPPNYRWSYDGSDNVWFSAGDAYARVLNGSVALAEYKFNVK